MAWGEMVGAKVCFGDLNNFLVEMDMIFICVV